MLQGSKTGEGAHEALRLINGAIKSHFLDLDAQSTVTAHSNSPAAEATLIRVDTGCRTDESTLCFVCLLLFSAALTLGFNLLVSQLNHQYATEGVRDWVFFICFFFGT